MKLKHISLTIKALIIGVCLSSCGSVKLAESWKSEDFKSISEDKILVVARSEDNDVRKAYENALVSAFHAKGIDAESALIIFPNLKENKNPSKEEVANILELFKSKGITKVVLTALKDTKTTYVGNDNSNTSSVINYQKKYGISFVDYYNVHSIEYLNKSLRQTDSNLQKLPEVPLSFKSYILEAVVYDFSAPENNQLVGVFDVEAKEPESADQVLNNFVKIISKQF